MCFNSLKKTDRIWNMVRIFQKSTYKFVMQKFGQGFQHESIVGANRMSYRWVFLHFPDEVCTTIINELFSISTHIHNLFLSVSAHIHQLKYHFATSCSTHKAIILICNTTWSQFESGLYKIW